MRKYLNIILYTIFIVILNFISSSSSYECFFYNKSIDISMLLDILKIYFTKYNLVIIVFFLWLKEFNDISSIYIIREKDTFIYLIKNIYKYIFIICVYFIIYGISIHLIYIDNSTMIYLINFLITNILGSSLLFLILVIIELIFKNKNIFIIYFFSIFILIINSSVIHNNKYLNIFYQLIDVIRYKSLNFKYFITYIISISIMFFMTKILLKKVDIS